MASINTIVKRKQYLWLGIVVAGIPFMATAFLALFFN